MKKEYKNYDKEKSNLPPPVPDKKVNNLWLKTVKRLQPKIIVLDDDPTGVQTVHSVPVYTSWDKDSIKKIMREKSKVVYILTNSRSLNREETKKMHLELTYNLVEVFNRYNRKFTIISRSDSTLRGHYPLETRTIKEVLTENKMNIDGEIIIPFFQEGGRLTFNDIHYVKEGKKLIPAGETEYAGDPNFGYKASNLKKWIEEKTGGNISSSQVDSISLELLREENYEEIRQKIQNLNTYNDKLIVNSVNYNDLKVFTVALIQSLKTGKNYIYRTAASFVRVFGGIKEKKLLSGEELLPEGRGNPGLVIIGSYVNKTTRQFNQVKDLSSLAFIEWKVNKVKDQNSYESEIKRVTECINNAYEQGKHICVYTSREPLNIEDNNRRKSLKYSNRISKGLVKSVEKAEIKPSYIIAKGGITSSDIGVHALKVDKALVLGQIYPGVPVWKLGEKSKFPGIPYVIFPGNVGEDNTLKNVIKEFIDSP
ncbi:MAG: four-carbon acid sugar kinase family protein [Halanaerobiales bacterium]